MSDDGQPTAPYISPSQERADQRDDERGREQMWWDRVDRFNDYTPAEHVTPLPLIGSDA